MTDSKQAEELEQRLRRIEREKTGCYERRTEHLDEDGNPLFINRLILEDSPYLLQHAHNPVNWYAWGSEPFEVASRENKPLFLSIGYSTCHWCHVMEAESFDNVEVGELLNRNFICIKLDKEQYPDIDEIYMTGVQLMSGQGGWPMSNFLLPDGKPFFGATYFPPPSFINLLQKIVAAWETDKPELERSATSINDAIHRLLTDRKEAQNLEDAISDNVAQALLQREDRSLGGLAGAPKFPQEPLLLFMLDRARRSRDLKAIGFVERALEAMGHGGIYDQVGGGFHRYSVDEQWLVPHFEKMLYNQSQLGLVYLEAFQLTGNAFFGRICRQTLGYVLCDMQLEEGGFCSATDADSEGAEGVFFLWTVDELHEVLSDAEAELVIAVYNATELGNFEGSNILNLSKPLADHEQQFAGNFLAALDEILHKLYLAREQRIHPLRDDKLIVAWTGAMVTTLARAGFQLGNSEWIRAAGRAARFVCQQNIDEQGRLSRVYLHGASSIDGRLEDYVNLTQALIALFDVTSNRDYLERAVSLMDVVMADFWDGEQAGFFLSGQNQPGPQLARSRNAGDGATLSAVAIALECLVKLKQRSALLDARHDTLFYAARIDAAIASVTGRIHEHPMSHASLLRLIDEYRSNSLDPIQYAGNGLVKISIRHSKQASDRELLIDISLHIEHGWHITAPQQAAGGFVPIELGMADRESCWRLQKTAYPDAIKTLQLNQTEIQIYENELAFTASLIRSEMPDDDLSTSVALELELQLCDDRQCLLPETLQFVV
ncbi:MAG: thioredoxin domain-containing protein [Gammaproteobacteria bacterium]|nr:thioredoxin domain-containing protein [Gammaproteobacteria bacterium]MDP6731886.1 thioredoxin domain-containing protein [Gammaproteobacteria bacterium]